MNLLAALVAPFKWLGHALFGKLPFCSLAGALAGMPVGFLFGLYLFEIGSAGLPIPYGQLVQGSLLLAFFGWLFALLVLCSWLRYRFASVAWPALLNSVLTSLLTLFWLHALAIPALGTLVGLISGVLVGAIFCWICRRTGFAAAGVSRG